MDHDLKWPGLLSCISSCLQSFIPAYWRRRTWTMPSKELAAASPLPCPSCLWCLSLSFPPLLLCTAHTGCPVGPALQNSAAGVTCLKPACSMNFWQFLLVNVLIRNRFQAQQHLQSTVMPLGTLPHKSISLQCPKTHSEHCTNTFHTYTQITLSHSGLEN